LNAAYCEYLITSRSNPIPAHHISSVLYTVNLGICGRVNPAGVVYMTLNENSRITSSIVLLHLHQHLRVFTNVGGHSQESNKADVIYCFLSTFRLIIIYTTFSIINLDI
jgi:hypothetical protein